MEQSDFVFCKLTGREALEPSPAVRIYLGQFICTLDGQAFHQGFLCVWIITLSRAIADK